MELVILGSGTSVPHEKRAAAAHWLETTTGSLLLDAGSDMAHRMAQEHLDWPNLDAIWVSHFHLDHLGGLAPFLFGMRWAPQMRARTKPFKIYGPERLGKLLNTINESNNYKLLDQPFPVELIEVTADDSFEILHTQESLAIRLWDKRGVSLVYTSDTGYSEELADFARRANVLVMECSFRRNKPISTHLELAEAMQLAAACEPQTLILTHFYSEWDGVDIVKEARALWPGEVLAAADGLRFEF